MSKKATLAVIFGRWQPLHNGHLTLAQATIRRSIEDEVILYASINPSNIFGKVLQGCAR